MVVVHRYRGRAIPLLALPFGRILVWRLRSRRNPERYPAGLRIFSKRMCEPEPQW